jgi:hypothetical protein
VKRLLASFALAALLAGAANAQQAQFRTGIGNTTAPGVTLMCLNAAGLAVPLALCDQWPGVSQPLLGATPEQRGQVVTISPNSGAPNPYPVGSVPLTETATGTTGGTTATFPAIAGKTNWLCGFSVSPGSATAAITITVTTTGLTNNFTLNVGAPVTAAGTTGTPLVHPITPCVPASATNTAITVVAGALGSGGVGQDVNAWGYRQ